MPYSKIIICLLITLSSIAQLNYNGSKPQVFDLIKTELDLTPNWEKAQMNGKAHLELSPFFYPQSAVILDAKGFEIIGIKLNGNTWENFTYDGIKLNIELDKTYEKTEKISLEINYIAKPNELTEIEGLSHPELKGLYFVKAENPIDRQLWTEGETEYNSCWFPTIDSPNEKHIQTIHLTVDSIYTTLSNGLLTKSENLPQGKRKDTWEQNKPHSVYLTMIAAGNFTKVIDTTFNDFEVSYYVEPTFASDAMAIFGHTPEMIRLFETQLGVKYPWQKYAQITVKEYISGAMENTSATILGAGVQKTKAQLIDTNEDAIIAHELFHHWFGDLVTCESWANLSLNEGFADYSEQLWAEHKYGKPEGEFTAISSRNQYFQEASEGEKEVIRYGYDDKEDMFDSHTYAKGGRIIHMLRRLVGDEAFWKGLNLYLNKHAYQTVEIHDLRLAMEEVTGLDLNWFFNQWFWGAGHPDLFVEHSIENGQLSLYVEQTQVKNEDDKPFQFPLEVLLGTKSGELTKTFWVDESEEYFDIKLDDSLKYIFIDPSASLLAKVDHVKTDELLLAQMDIENSIAARMEAFDLLTYTPDDGDGIILNPIYKKSIREMVLKTTEDPFWRLRDKAVQKLFDYDGEDFLTVEKQLQSVIKTDKKSQVRASAILAMKNFLNAQNDLLFRNALNDSSLMVQAAALEAILMNNPPDGALLVKKYRDVDDVNIFGSIANFIAADGDPEDFEWFKKKISHFDGTEKYQVLGLFGTYLIQTDEETRLKAIPFLQKLATNESMPFVRFQAAQCLMLISESPEAINALKEIIPTETDENLIELYKQFPLD